MLYFTGEVVEDYDDLEEEEEDDVEDEVCIVDLIPVKLEIAVTRHLITHLFQNLTSKSAWCASTQLLYVSNG